MKNRVFESVRCTLAEAATAAGTTDIESAIYDLADYDGIAFLFTVLAVTTGAVTSVGVQVGDAANLSDAALVSGLAITIADDDDNQSFLVDYAKGSKRYARLLIDRATQNAAVGEVYAMQYGAKLQPVTNTVADTLTVDNN